MKTKQTIAIIGAGGRMGSAIARSLAKGNYRLLLYSASHHNQDLVESILRMTPGADIESVGCTTEASWEADIIILAVPYRAEKEIAAKIRDLVNQKIIVSIANPLNENFDGLVTRADTSAAEELQQLLPFAKVVKSFNTTFAADFGQTVIAGNQVDAFVAGNDCEAVQTVAELVQTAGFNPLIAGDLAASRTLEQMQLLMIRLNNQNNYNSIAGWKVLHN